MNRTILIIVMVVIVVGGITAWVVFSGDGTSTDTVNTTVANSNANANTNTTTNVNRVASQNANTAVSNTNQTGTNTNASSNSNVNTNVNSNANTNTATTTVPGQVSVSATSTGGFSPTSVTVKVGGTVTWKNNGSGEVYVAPDVHPSHDNYPGIWEDDGRGEISAGESYSVTFSTAGIYRYHDHDNTSRTGTVIVQ